MDSFVADFAGKERAFRLRFGEIVDLETACDTSFGVLYQRIATTTFHVRDVQQVLLRGLVGGGMAVQEAEPLVKAQMDAKPLFDLGTLALDIILRLAHGMPKIEDLPDPDTPEDKIEWGKVLLKFLELGWTPEQVRAMRYADYISMITAAGGKKQDAPSEEEFKEILRAFEARQQSESSDT